MRVWSRLEGYTSGRKAPLVLSVGNFEGVHLGHQQILKRVLERAKEIKGIPAVLTFHEHPQRVLSQSREPGLLTSSQHRLLLFHKIGIKDCFLLHFTIPFSKMTPKEFVEEILLRRLAVKEVHLGYNAHFGVGREGDSDVMRQLACQYGFGFYETRSVKIGEEFVSSTLIRHAIKAGDLEKARRLLGRPFNIFASVVRGSGRGRTLGFPTANLRPHSEILPPRGVYPVRVRESSYHLKTLTNKGELEFSVERPGGWFLGVLNFGIRPTFSVSLEPESIPEVHLINFSGNLYGKTVEVVFYPRLREEKTFSGAYELSQAIERDVVEARTYLESSEASLFTKGVGAGIL